MSAYENLKLVCKIKEISSDKIEEKLKLVGLWEFKDRKFKAFSLGMKQRLAMARFRRKKCYTKKIEMTILSLKSLMIKRKNILSTQIY